MRVVKVTNNILKINNEYNDIQYLVCKNVDIVREDKSYYNSVIIPDLKDVKSKYILMSSKSKYEYTFLLYHDKTEFIKACCEPLSLNLNEDDLLKIK